MIKNNELISVIIPVYNVEKYINKCLDSVENQTYSNIEIILIDDGSQDNSGTICNEYAKRDSRIRVIHKKNEGVAVARNHGLKESKGSFITFVDSDDIVEDDYIEYLYNLLTKNNVDIACCNFEYIYEQEENHKGIEHKEIKEKTIVYDNKEALKNLLYQKEIDTSPWGKIYRREIFKDIIFPIGKIYEDFGTIYKTIINARRVAYGNQKKYLYLQRNTSTIGRDFCEKDFDMLELSIEMKKYILDKYPELENAINSRIINMDFYFIRRIDKNKYKSEYKKIKNDIIQKRKKVLKDKNIKLKTRIAIYISYINIDITKYIYIFIKKIKVFGINNYLTKYKE